jgi:hypothetical protein
MSTFDASFSGIGELLRSAEMQAAMHGKAERIAEAARATAPVGPATDGTHYRDAFEVSSGVREGSSRRAYGQVENTSDHAAAVEFGNFRTRAQTIEAHHVLGRALDAAKD